MTLNEPTPLSSFPSDLTESWAYIHPDGSVGDKYHSVKQLYAHRVMLQALLYRTWAELDLYDVHRSWHHHPDDAPMFESSDPARPYFVVVACLPSGQLTNHYKADKWDLFDGVPVWSSAAPWDGGHGLAEGLCLLEMLGPQYRPRLSHDVGHAAKFYDDE